MVNSLMNQDTHLFLWISFLNVWKWTIS